MKSIITRTLAGAGALGIAAAGLVAVASPAGAAGALTINPESGDGDTLVRVETDGGCASANATGFIVKLSGASLADSVNMVGYTPLTSIGTSGANTDKMSAPLSKTFGNVNEEVGGLKSGSYTLTFECRNGAQGGGATFMAPVQVRVSAGSVSWFQGNPPAPEPIVNTAKPKVTGTAKVGKTLKVSTGTWSVASSELTYKYQWKRGSKVVSKKASYKLTKADKGKTLKVTVTVSATGYANGKATVSTKKIK
jgi:hypothetical protein